MNTPTIDRQKMRVYLNTGEFFRIDREADVTLQNGTVKKAKELGLRDIVFDRNGNLAHVVAHALDAIHLLDLPPRNRKRD